MTTSDVGRTTSTTAVPQPRAAADDAVTSAGPHDKGRVEETVEAPHFPWPEPWHFSRGARPRTEFWDVATASWRSRGPMSTGGATE